MKLLKINPARRKSLLVLPLIVIPGLCLVFYTLGGGRGGRPSSGGSPLGLNLELPKASVEGHQLLSKKLQYEQAERDSLRKVQYLRQDPYRKDSTVGVASRPAAAGFKPPLASDQRADQVLSQLEKLRESIRQPEVPAGRGMQVFPRRVPDRIPEDTTGDARVGRLNEMLDKVERIQHPEQTHAATASLPAHTDEIVPADSAANVIAAVVADDQILVTGTTIGLRILDSIRLDGLILPAGQLIYGTVTINRDRMLVHINALRRNRNLYTVDLQVYDLDGIAGIHIPGVLGRDVAKESADQGVGSLNVLSVDPSLGAQAAEAGVQMAKTFASRKVRQVRVGVQAGYQLLLRETHVRALSRGGPTLGTRPAVDVTAPPFLPKDRVAASCRNEGVELQLRNVCLMGEHLWFGLQYTNHTAIAYTPAYARWFIRDRHQLRRTAIQELTIEPIHPAGLTTVAGDSTECSWTGFTPFVLSKDKELILEVVEKGGGRTLTLRIKHTTLLNAKIIQP